MKTFQEVEFEFENNVSGMTLRGTLAIPDSKTEHDFIVLVTGSGAHNRDEQIGQHKPFKQISDYLANNGFAILRYDDRHYGMPTKKAWQYTTADFVTDVQAAINAVARKKEIHIRTIGIIGHSEGGIIASWVATIDSRVKAVIGLGSPAISMGEIAKRQNSDFGSTTEKMEKYGEAILSIIEEESDETLRRRKIWKKYFEFNGYFKISKMLKQYRHMDMAASNWSHQMMKIDPALIYGKIHCNALMLFGEYDIQVHCNENIAKIHEINDKYGTHIEARMVKFGNHLFQRVESIHHGDYNKLVKEYIENKEGIMPTVLEQMVEWLNDRLDRNNTPS